MKKALLLANGFHPSKSVIQFLRKSGFNTLVCADGGANSAYKMNLIPDLIIGDLDSIEYETNKYFSSKSKIIKYSRQNDTDVEKCLKYLKNKNYDEVIFLGTTGDRLDHSFCNLGIVLKYFDQIKISILHQKSFLKCYTGKIKLNTVKNEIISLYGFDNKTKVSSSGLKYALLNASLKFGEKESTSNAAVGENVNLDIRGGRIFVIRDFQTMRKNGYFQQS